MVGYAEIKTVDKQTNDENRINFPLFGLFILKTLLPVARG